VRRLFAISSLLAALGAFGCRRASEVTQPSPAPAKTEARPTDTQGLQLPEALGGFTAVSAPETGPGWVRRSYRRGGGQIDVTLARTQLPPGGYDAWVRASQGFQQATLDAPAADANGFYQCFAFPIRSCDLKIQLRSGVHVELNGHGAGREDVDALAAALPLRALSVPAPDAP
jgi:hypothetical protein